MYRIKKVTYDGKYICVKFGGYDFSKSKEIVKALPQSERFYDSKDKVWKVHDNIENIKYLRENGFDICKELFERIVPPLTKPWINIKIPEEYDFLREYQQEGLQFLSYNNGRGLLSLDTGLGKSLCSLAYVNWKNLFPVLIITLSAVKKHWENEFERWFNADKKIKILSGMESVQEMDEYYDIMILNYDILSRHMIDKDAKEQKNRNDKYKPDPYLLNFKRNKIKSIIFDETQRMKSDDTKITYAVQFLSTGVDCYIGLSATPLVNKPAELYSTLNIIKPELFNNKWSFLHRFCGPEPFIKNNRTIWSFKGATNTAELHYILKKSVMLRYKKDEVKKQLPFKERVVIPLEVTDYKEYNEIVNEIEAEILDGNKALILGKFEKLRQAAFSIKLNSVIEWIEEQLTKSEKIVIFAWNKIAIEEIYRHFKSKTVKLTGETTEKQKFKNIERFIEDPKIKIFLGNIAAAGTGIDGLQRVCNIVCYLQFPWTAAAVDQATGRIFRHGQTCGTMEYFLVAPKTIEEDVIKLIDSKKEINSNILDGGNYNKDELLNVIYRKYLKIAKNKKG